MAKDLPGPPDGGNPDQRPGDRPTEAARYAPAGYEYQPTQQTEPLATVALVIAIAGFFLCPPVAAIVALILANSARQRIQASGRHLGGLEQVKAARIIAIVELILSAIVVLVLAVGAVVALNQQRTGLDEPVPVDSTRAWAPSSWSTAASSGGSAASLGIASTSPAMLAGNPNRQARTGRILGLADVGNGWRAGRDRPLTTSGSRFAWRPRR